MKISIKIIIRIFVISFLTVNIEGAAQIITYPPTNNITQVNKFIEPSSHYTVELIQNGVVKQTFVYMMHAQQYTNNCKTESWCNFSFKGKVTIKVTRLKGDVKYCRVLPLSEKIIVKKQKQSIEFDIDKPGQFSVEFQKGVQIDNALFVFANPIESNIPNEHDPDVIYFGPGVHDIGKRFVIPSNKTVYISGSAYVKGMFYSENSKNVTIRGRGILSGEDYPVREGNHMIIFNHCINDTIAGITIINAPKWNISLSGRNQVVRNVKLLSWYFSTDGIGIGQNSIIENCFLKVNDDAIKLYSSNTIARYNVIWQMENGAPFQIGWGGNDIQSNFHAYNNDVIRVQQDWDNENDAVFCAIFGGSGHRKDYLFENIRINNAPWRIFSLVTKPNRWVNWDPEQGNISDFTFKNITVYGKQRMLSLIRGWDKNHMVYNFTFDNLVMDGKKVKNLKDANIEIYPETTKNIFFK